ncbi:OadG family protein [Desulfomarina sp.]
MTTIELLAEFANPDTIHTLSLADKLFAGLFATILGMGITFAALVLLQFVIVFMEKLMGNMEKQTCDSVDPAASASVQAPTSPPDNTELVAVISTVLATQLNTSPGNIIIKNITRIDPPSPAWNRAGILEQMNSRL